MPPSSNTNSIGGLSTFASVGPGLVRGRLARASHECDVLLSVDHVCNRRRCAGLVRLDLQKLFALVGAVRQQPAVTDYLENQVARRGDRTAAGGATARCPPHQLLIHRVPRFQNAALSGQRLRPDDGRHDRWWTTSGEACSRMPVWRRDHFVGRHKHVASLRCREIDQTGRRIV